MSRPKTKGRDPAHKKLPDRVVGQTHKSIAKEMRPTGGRDAENTSPSSSNVFVFTCSVCGKTKKNRLVTKTRALDEGREHRACSGCGAKPFKIGGRNKGEWLWEELLDQVVPDPELTPISLLVTGMRELRLWQCNCRSSGSSDKNKPDEPFYFSATVAARTRKKEEDRQNCPACSYHGPRVNASNRRKFQKYLNRLVQDSRNRGYLSLLDDGFPIEHSAYFRCEQGHVCYCSIQLMQKKDCVTCYANMRKGTNLANRLFKHLWDEFVCAPAYPDFERQDIPSGSSTIVVLWRCKQDPAHEWLSYPFRRTRDLRGCPFCGHKRLANGESLAERFPEIAMEFDSAANLSPVTGEPLSPNTIWCTDRHKYWFLCPAGHSYKASVVARTAQGKGCKQCEIQPRSIAKLRPDLALQWHVKKNKQEFPQLTPSTLTLASNKKVWWLCAEARDHQWLVAVKDRASKDSGCPFCNGLKLSQTNTIWKLYPKVARAFDAASNPEPAKRTRAVLRNKYSWRCKCGREFERRLVHVLSRGLLCGDCPPPTTRQDKGNRSAKTWWGIWGSK